MATYANKMQKPSGMKALMKRMLGRKKAMVFRKSQSPAVGGSSFTGPGSAGGGIGG